MNCSKCNQPMKEYVGFLETGWDCTNEHCGKSDSHTFTVPTPESATYKYKTGYGIMLPGTKVGEWKPAIKQFPEIKPIDVKIFAPPTLDLEQPSFPLSSDVSDIFLKEYLDSYSKLIEEMYRLYRLYALPMGEQDE